MDWELTVLPRLCEALMVLQNSDSQLFRTGSLVGERAIAHRLAVYLEGLFPTFDVDCEYNKMSDEPMMAKRVMNARVREIKNEQRRERNADVNEDEDELVCPDICIHRRGLPDRADNLLVIELKKHGNETQINLDHAKLTAFTSGDERFSYQYGLFFVIGAGGNITGATLYINGKGVELNVSAFPQRQTAARARVARREREL